MADGVVFDRGYRRLGPRYPLWALAGALRLEHVIVIAGAAVLALYVPVSLPQFALLAAAAVVGQEFYAQLTLRHFRRRLSPLTAWLEGQHQGDGRVAAWQTAASMPFELLRLWWRGGYPIIAGLGWCLAAVWILSLPAWNIPILFLVIQVLLVYANGIAALLVERAMQPVLMDVRGFTALSERAPARKVVARLNELYDVVVPTILKHGGHANKFIGDGLLAVFGAPQRHEDHADRAVSAGLEIAREVNTGSANGLRVGLGINSGTVVVGTIGGGGRLDFTVIGDAVNTAARVESATRETGDDLLITDETLQRLHSEHCKWEERAPIPLKGKAATVPLYAPAEPH